MAEMKKVPAIRFKGFSDVWTESNFLDNIEKIIDFRGRTPKKLGLDWSESGYLALSALNVKSGYIDFKVDAHYGNQELYDKWMLGNELHKNQVLFTTEAPMGNVAQIPDDEKYILSQRTIAFEVKPSLLAEDFLAIVLGSPKTFKKLTSMSSGGTAKGVSQKSLATLDLTIPSDTTEQTQIGSYFQHLDKLISLHQTKVNKLTNLKKAMLEKMFPKQGADVPEIRFRGFAGAWQKKRLGELGKAKSGVGFPDIEQGGLSGIPFFKVSDMNNLGNEHEMLIANNYVTHEQITRKKWSPVTEIPAIVFAKVGAAIMLNRKRLVRSKFLMDNNTMAYIFDASWDEDFGKSCFDTINLPLYAQVGALPSYNASDIESIEVIIPRKKLEQKEIGSFFKKLDKSISLHQTELEKLNNLKKACLEKMFV